MAEQGLNKGWLAERAADLVLEAGGRIDAALLQIETAPDQAGLVHGDLHQWNSLYRGDAGGRDRLRRLRARCV